MIEEIKVRIAEIEAAIAKLVSDHAVLTGHLGEAKHFLDMATKAAEVIAPESCVAEALEIVDNVADAIVE